METRGERFCLVSRLETVFPRTFAISFATVWTAWKLLVALASPLISWDGMVYWLNGQSYLQGRYPVYEFFRPPVLPLFLGLTQALGLGLWTSVIWHPIVTGASGIMLFLVLRLYAREWLAATGTFVFLTTSIVQFWSVTILTHGFATLFLLTGAYFITKSTFKNEVIGATFLSVAFFTRYPLGLVILPFAAWVAIRRRRLVDVDALVIGGLLPVAPFVLSQPSFLLDTVNEIFAAEVLGQKSVFVASNSVLATSPSFYLAWLGQHLGPLFIVLTIGLLAAIRTKNGLVFALWFFPYVVGFSLLSNRQDRFVFELAPALAALVVLGAEHLLRNMSHPKIVGMTLLLVVGYFAVNETLTVASQAPIGFQLNDTQLSSTFQIVGREIQTHTNASDIVVAENDVPWLSYYSSRYVYLSRTSQVTDGLAVENYLRSLHPFPTLLVAMPFYGSNIALLKSQTYLGLVEIVNTPAWGQVYIFRVSVS